MPTCAMQTSRMHNRRFNLSQAQLDGADLNGNDLSFTSCEEHPGGADLRNSLFGTDLRNSDLTGALLDQQALDRPLARNEVAQGP